MTAYCLDGTPAPSPASCQLFIEASAFDRDCYMPAVPMYFDDMDTFLTYNAWCGEEAAVNDLNAAQTHRKMERQKRDFRIKRFHVAQP